MSTGYSFDKSKEDTPKADAHATGETTDQGQHDATGEVAADTVTDEPAEKKSKKK